MQFDVFVPTFLKKTGRKYVFGLVFFLFSVKIEIFEFAASIESIRLKFCLFTTLESLKAQVEFHSLLIIDHNLWCLLE